MFKILKKLFRSSGDNGTVCHGCPYPKRNMQLETKLYTAIVDISHCCLTCIHHEKDCRGWAGEDTELPNLCIEMFSETNSLSGAWRWRHEDMPTDGYK